MRLGVDGHRSIAKRAVDRCALRPLVENAEPEALAGRRCTDSGPLRSTAGFLTGRYVVRNLLETFDVFLSGSRMGGDTSWGEVRHPSPAPRRWQRARAYSWLREYRGVRLRAGGYPAQRCRDWLEGIRERAAAPDIAGQMRHQSCFILGRLVGATKSTELVSKL